MAMSDVLSEAIEEINGCDASGRYDAFTDRIAAARELMRGLLAVLDATPDPICDAHADKLWRAACTRAKPIIDRYSNTQSHPN